jgi:hypothetical protein
MRATCHTQLIFLVMAIVTMSDVQYEILIAKKVLVPCRTYPEVSAKVYWENSISIFLKDTDYLLLICEKAVLLFI